MKRSRSLTAITIVIYFLIAIATTVYSLDLVFAVGYLIINFLLCIGGFFDYLVM